MKKSAARLLRSLGFAVFLLALAAFGAAASAAEPIKIGFSMALTGSIAANGKAALTAIKMWADDVNAKGGLLGRKVDLVYYDDQSSAAAVPGIYTKLLDVDKVDIVVSPYGTNLIAPAMPVVMQHGLTLMGLFGVGVNSLFHYDRYFQIMPLGPESNQAIPAGFFATAMTLDPKPKTVAIVGADAEFGKLTTDAARTIARRYNLKIVYDRSYPPSTVDFSPIIRAIQQTAPDLVFVGAYPADSVGMVRAANELGLKTMLFGGGLVGLQYAAVKAQLGPLLNGVVDYELYVPSPTLTFPGIAEFLQRYQEKAATEGVDPLGFYVPPFVYAAMQILGESIAKTGSLDQQKLADYLHHHGFATIVGDVRFAENGEWDKARVLMTQYRGVAGSDLDQFRKPGTQIILYPGEYKSGEVVYPFPPEKR